MRPRLAISARILPRRAPSPNSEHCYFHSSTQVLVEDHQRKDIVPGNLKATLEAHRASNRSLRVRRVDSENKQERGKEPSTEVQDKTRDASTKTSQGTGTPTTSQADGGGTLAINKTSSAGSSIIRYEKSTPFFELYRDVIFTKLKPEKQMMVKKAFKMIREKAISESGRSSMKVEVSKIGRVVSMQHGHSTKPENQFKPWENEWTKAEPNREER